MMSAFIYFFTHLTSYITSPPSPSSGLTGGHLFERMKEIPSGGLSGSSPARVGTTSGLRWVVYLVGSSDRDTRQKTPAALRLRTERRENYLNKEKSDFYGYTDTLDRKVRLRGEMKGFSGFL